MFSEFNSLGTINSIKVFSVIDPSQKEATQKNVSLDWYEMANS